MKILKVGGLNTQLHANFFYDHAYFVSNHVHFCTIVAATMNKNEL